MGGFTGNESGVRKVLVLLLGAFTFGAWRKKRQAKKAAEEAKRIASEGYPATRCAVCRDQPCSCEAGL